MLRTRIHPAPDQPRCFRKTHALVTVRASQKLVPYICSTVSILFYLRRRINRCPRAFVPVRHTRPTFRVGWLTFQPGNLVVAFFSRVALWASRAEVWVLFALDTSRDCRKSDCLTDLSDCPTNLCVCRNKHLINRLTAACEMLPGL